MIKIHNLMKSFGKLQVLDHINIVFEAGKITALVGPNGAGKTTLIKSILGLITPDSGEIFIGDQKLGGEWEYRRKIGYMPQIAHFPENLRVEELLFMIKDLRTPPYELDEALLEEFAVEAELGKPLRTLSGGTRQKINAIIAFLFNPEFLVLDEPTAGLDPISSSKLKDKLFTEREKGKTILLTSHIMSEIEELAEHIIFLLEGKVYFDGSIYELKENAGEFNLERSIARLMTRGVAA